LYVTREVDFTKCFTFPLDSLDFGGTSRECTQTLWVGNLKEVHRAKNGNYWNRRGRKTTERIEVDRTLPDVEVAGAKKKISMMGQSTTSCTNAALVLIKYSLFEFMYKSNIPTEA